MIGAIIGAGVKIADGISDTLAQRAEDNASTAADGTMNYGSYSKGMNLSLANAALTNPAKLLSLIGQKKAMKRKIAAQKLQYNSNTINTAVVAQDNGLKNGGKMKRGTETTAGTKAGELVGKGGPKDDAIPATLNKGDVVIPADADPQIVAYIMEKLGLNKQVDETDAAAGNGADVNLSNGETIIPAAYVKQAEQIAGELGMSLNDLMPNATTDEPQQGGEYKDGILSGTGMDPDRLVKKTFGDSTSGIGKTKLKSPSRAMSKLKPLSSTGGGNLTVGQTPAKVGGANGGGFGKFVGDNASSIVGVAQMAAGALLSSSAGKRPDADTSGQLSSLAGRIAEKRRANIAVLKDSSGQAIEEKRRMGIDNAVRIAPGASSAIATAQEANSQAASDKNDINKQVATMSNEGLSQEGDLEARAIEMKQKVLEGKQNYYDKKMEGLSKLVGTGMQNVVDSIEYKKNRKALGIRNKLRNVDPLLNSSNTK